MRRLLITLIILLASYPYSSAQKAKTVTGEYIYYPPETQSMDEARRTALYRAQIQILADTYGTVMNMTSATVVQNSSDNSSVDMFSLGESSVKGEWLETVGSPEYHTEVTPDGMLAIRVKVTGKVREITHAQADFTARILRNGVDDKFEDSDFNAGDDMYMSFSAPADGYLAVYLFDGADDAYCLLPYQSSGEGVVKTKAGERYLFFSQDHPYGVDHASMVDEYTLTCSSNLEVNRVYVIWSTSSFIKANDRKEEELIPRMLDYASFQKWLSALRMSDRNLSVKTFDLNIRNNN